MKYIKENRPHGEKAPVGDEALKPGGSGTKQLQEEEPVKEARGPRPEEAALPAGAPAAEKTANQAQTEMSAGNATGSDEEQQVAERTPSPSPHDLHYLLN